MLLFSLSVTQTDAKQATKEFGKNNLFLLTGKLVSIKDSTAGINGSMLLYNTSGNLVGMGFTNKNGEFHLNVKAEESTLVTVYIYLVGFEKYVIKDIPLEKINNRKLKLEFKERPKSTTILQKAGGFGVSTK